MKGEKTEDENFQLFMQNRKKLHHKRSQKIQSFKIKKMKF